MKAPRYMREYAEHIRSECERYNRQFPENEGWKEIIKEADWIIYIYEEDLITEQEAMRALSSLPY